MTGTRKATRVIAHLDMDAFYASVELLRYPELRGRAVVIGGGRDTQPVWEVAASGERHLRFATLRGYAGRGVVTTATYEARALGVNSAMGMMKAAAKAPDAVLLPVDFDEYRKYSRMFKAAVRALAPRIEDRGIDEIYVDLTEIIAARLPDDDEPVDPDDAAQNVWWCAREVGAELKQVVRTATGLVCSIGLAPNKLIAKIASELDKPDGLTVVTASDVVTRLWPLSVRRLHGVGPKSAAKLARLGIATIGELAQVERAWLAQHFGASYAAWLTDAARGRDERPIVTESEPKSISRETTFDRDLHAARDRATLSRVFTRLVEQLADDLHRKHYAGRTIGIKLRFDDFSTVTRDQTLPAAISDARAIRRAAGECLKRVDLTRRIRLLGVRAGTLEPMPPG